jgi:hypothetical protein
MPVCFIVWEHLRTESLVRRFNFRPLQLKKLERGGDDCLVDCIGD